MVGCCTSFSGCFGFCVLFEVACCVCVDFSGVVLCFGCWRLRLVLIAVFLGLFWVCLDGFGLPLCVIWLDLGMLVVGGTLDLCLIAGFVILLSCLELGFGF